MTVDVCSPREESSTNIREGTLAYYDVLADKPQDRQRLNQGRFDVTPMIDHQIGEGLLAEQLTCFPKSGIIFRADKSGDPILKHEAWVREQIEADRRELRMIAGSARYDGTGTMI